MKSTIRVYLRYARSLEDRKADLNPPLGDPGGPCQVMKRIEDQVRNPHLKEELIEEVSKGKDLPNSDAAKVYPLDHEGHAGIAKNLIITSHAQYRMDLRGVTVKDVQTALKNYTKMMNDLKAMKHPGYERMQRELASGKVEFIDPKTNLEIVFSVNGRESATIISTFWKGKQDPKPVPPQHCKLSTDTISLVEDPWKYFQKLPGSFLVPVSDLETVRARPSGIEHAEEHMLNVYNGHGARRIPIKVKESGHGKFEVVDGNSTTAIARRHGWKSIPAILVEEGDVHH